MNKTAYKQGVRWLAVAVWMAVIFYLSGQTGNDSGGLSEVIVRWFVGSVYRGFEALPLVRQTEILDTWHTVIRKGAHFAEYAVLAALLANAIRSYAVAPRLKWWLPVAVSAIYAVTDEVHQYFIPGRACRALDVGIDTCGAMFGAGVFAVGLYLIAKKRRP